MNRSETNHGNHSQKHCDDRPLISMLRREKLGATTGQYDANRKHDADCDPDHDAMLEHIETCNYCQTRLEALAANDDDWKMAGDVLSTGDLAAGDADDSDATYRHVNRDAFRASRLNQRTVAWTESMAKHLLSPPSHPEMLGRLGRYDVERVVGSGGMGVVFKAFDTELNRPVAIKVLAPYLSGSGPARRRFTREARAAAAIVHEHVVPIHNVETEGDTPYLVMQYVAGESLQGRIDREGPLDVCEILRIATQVASGLAAAHAQGLVHRDIKPSNILLEPSVERALITDFGLARAADDASITHTGFHPGTPQYMSPEQAAGDSVDARSDLFSLGSVLYAMCTGRPPFRAETTLAILRRIADDEARPIQEITPNIPAWLCAIINKLMAKRSEDRYGSADEAANLLEQCLAHAQQPSVHHLPQELQPVVTDRGRNARPPVLKFLAAVTGGFLTLLFGVLIVLEWNKGTMTIECEADDVPIRITQGDKIVEQLTVSRSGKTVRLAAGAYEVEIDNAGENIAIADGTVMLKRGDTEVVRIVSQGSSADEAKPGSSDNPKTPKLINQLQGRWVVTRIVDPQGADYRPQADTGWVVEGSSMTSFGGSHQITLPFRVDEQHKPAHFDVLLGSEDNSDLLGLIEVTGNKIRWANSGNTFPKKPVRPAALEPALGMHYAELEHIDGEQTQPTPETNSLSPAAEMQRISGLFAEPHKQLEPSEARSLDEITSVYNEKTRQLRHELFNPPIPDLTIEQMQAAMMNAAEVYRNSGDIETASVFQTCAESKRLPDGVIFSGVTGTKYDGHRQITPGFLIPNGAGFNLAVLDKAELHYSRTGWSSKSWGDLIPPFDGVWELASVEMHGERLTPEQFAEWKAKHAEWGRLEIVDKSLSMSGNSNSFDFSIDDSRRTLFQLKQAEETKFDGRIMSNAADDFSKMFLAVNFAGTSIPATFNTKDSDATALNYTRVGKFQRGPSTEDSASAVPANDGQPMLPKLAEDDYVKSGVPLADQTWPIPPWGEEKNGLSAGLRIIGAAHVGGTVQAELWIRNSSDKNITFSQCGRVDVGLVVVARDNDKEHFAEVIPFDGIPLFNSLLLPPGHITKVKEFTIKLGARGEDNAELHWAVLALPPGEYKLHATWSDSHPWVTHVGDWNGELTTGEVDFRIVDRLWR